MRRGHEAGPGCKANCKPEGKARAGVVRGRGQEVEPTRSCKARGAGATQKAWLLQGGARGVARARRRGEQRQAEPRQADEVRVRPRRVARLEGEAPAGGEWSWGKAAHSEGGVLEEGERKGDGGRGAGEMFGGAAFGKDRLNGGVKPEAEEQIEGCQLQQEGVASVGRGQGARPEGCT